jgi:hypothetical protein
VFFGLPEDEYHTAFAMSASGIKTMRVSTMDFFANSPLDPDCADEEIEAKIAGRAYHKWIVEGRDAFEAIYVADIEKAEFPDALDTVKEITAHLKYVGGPTKGLSKLNKSELIQMLWEYDPDALAEHEGGSGDMDHGL